ncbi:hypothetical protein CW705_00880 [Candidatus Bathyarchaeota archaeon]|nr:MAG: hypothetical protein CW705_00880 [Candidatus Bathyarchaeota archaeon]
MVRSAASMRRGEGIKRTSDPIPAILFIFCSMHYMLGYFKAIYKKVSREHGFSRKKHIQIFVP